MDSDQVPEPLRHNEVAEMVGAARSMLYVPGDRPDRFAKAEAAAPGMVILDLEDAVAARSKDHARGAVREWLAEGHRCVVRINPPGTEWHRADLDAPAGHQVAVMIPKADNASLLAEVTGRLPAGSCAIALIETAAGVVAAPSIAAVPGVRRLAFGNVDLAAQLGVDPADALALAAARGAIVLASAAAGLAAPLDGVTLAVDDPDGLRADAEHAARLGFGGKQCIYPRQVVPVDAAFRPTDAQLAWARRIVDGAGAADSAGVVLVDGRMVDRPVVDRARRIVYAARKEARR